MSDEIQIHSSASDYTNALVFQTKSLDFVFKIKTDGTIELGPEVTLDQASRAFWDSVSQWCPFLTDLKKQELQNWLQRKRALDSRDLHAVELLVELEQILGA